MPIVVPGIVIPTNVEISGTLESALPKPQIKIARQVQRQDAWCYAACAAMVIKLCTEKPIRQCRIAGFVKGNIPCCSTPIKDRCIRSGCRKNQIEPIFNHFGVKDQELGTSISLATVKQEINANPRRLIELVIDWNSLPGRDSSHAVLVVGFNDDFVYVIDPLRRGPYNGWTTHTSVKRGFGHGNWDMTWVQLMRA